MLSAGDNPRFIVSNLPVEGFKRYTNRALFSSTPLNEAFFCPRGEMTNGLAAGAQFGSGTLSTHFLASNQLRLWLGCFAYLLMHWLSA